jgi:hypothetical protein
MSVFIFCLNSSSSLKNLDRQIKRAIYLIGSQRFDEGTICTIQDLAKCCGMPYAMFNDSIMEYHPDRNQDKPGCEERSCWAASR